MTMKVEQYVMAYGVEQDRLRAFLPEGFVSLRPVLRINGEIREGETKTLYLELNTPVEAFGKRGWLNIAHWDSGNTDLTCRREGKSVTFRTPFLSITYTGTGAIGGCPAEKDNDGCFFLGEGFRPAERIDQKKEFCDCAFSWCFTETDAGGASESEKLCRPSLRSRGMFMKNSPLRRRQRRLSPVNRCWAPIWCGWNGKYEKTPFAV